MCTINIDQYSSISFLNTNATSLMSRELQKANGYTQKREAKEKICKKVEELFKSYFLPRFGSDANLIAKHWDVVFKQTLENSGHQKKDLITISVANEVFSALNDVIVEVDSANFDPFDKMPPGNYPEIRDFFRYVCSLSNASQSLLTPELFESFFHEQNPQVMHEAQEEIQRVLLSIFQEKDYLSDFKMELLVNQMVSILSFLEPQNSRKFDIPTKINGHWQMVQYQIKLIELTPDWVGTSLAYSLIPDKSSHADPIIVFRGTPPNPSAKGYYFARFTDLTPGLSVGEALYMFAKKRLAKWMSEINKEFPNNKVRAIGNSLGGTMTYHYAKDYPDKVIIYAIDPPGLQQRTISHLVRGKVFVHPSDWISKLDYHPVSAKMYKVITDTPRGASDAHAKAYGFEKAIYLNASPIGANNAFYKKVFRVFHVVFSIPIFLLSIGFGLALYYVIKIQQAYNGLHNRQPIEVLAIGTRSK
ncbi:MAG: hypothetical protein COT84_04955 [Chlamydiae bacterium CG10_big_fil_rev_8_21_14_0_10_35_9]|nr:MAG: hypothetical protein COT84_04955 [Chlamydiae bacterium CG10_big_fil_rev_8_21_14_0_10_35_9]